MAVSMYGDIMDRFVAIQTETFTCAAFPYAFATAPDFPYWTNRLGPASYRWPSQDRQLEDRTIVSRLVIGHATGSYEGITEETAYSLVDQWVLAMGCRTMLLSTAYPTALPYLKPETKLMLNDTGVTFFDDYNFRAQQVGIDFFTQITITRKHIPA